MTNKLFVIINSLRVAKIKKVLLYEMKFLVPNYSCLQNYWLWGLLPPDPRSFFPLSSTKFVEPPPPNKIPGYATGLRMFEKRVLRKTVWTKSEDIKRDWRKFHNAELQD